MRGFLAFAVLLVTFAGCGPEASPPFTLLEKFDQEDATVEIYSLDGEIDIEMLRRICLRSQRNCQPGKLAYVIVFDDRMNCVRSSSPYSAMYGNQENAMSHIVATYECNRGGYSALFTYSPNMANGKPNRLSL